ncbi:MAG: bifunctional pyr operon transcriptional regulator/uracil phosphoribosyltransferase PyrR [Bacteroidetes bacterium]|nr:bifunctional pyr operon transcriptional regulator/uracil phosphoribosyltransferase PyrR [Bacteroidota bacterium]
MAKVLLEGALFELTLTRLAAQLVENHHDFSQSVLIGLQPRGIYLALALHHKLQGMLQREIAMGRLDVTFHRDDFRRRNLPLVPSALDINFSLEAKQVVLIDDVFYTGRTVRAGLEAMMAFGRPSKVELLVLVDRKYSRHLPIQADYIGIKVDTRTNEKVKVKWMESDGEQGVWLLTEDESNAK